MPRRFSFALPGALSVVVISAVIAVGGAHAQTQSQTRANPPVQTKVAPPATKVAPPATKVTTPSQTKATTPPPAKATTPAQTKAGAPPPAKAATAGTQGTPAQSKAVPPPAKVPAPAAGAGAAKQVERPPTGADTAAKPGVIIMREAFSYSGTGRRDPFLSLVLSPEFRPALIDLKVSVILWSAQGGSTATINDFFSKKTVVARVGSVFGRMRVVAIHPNAVVFEIDDFGTTRRDSIVQRPDTTR